MNKITFSIFQKTDSLSLLRLLDHEDKLAGERELDDDAVATLASLAEAYYRRDTPQLTEIGSQLYGWLDGPTERWLARVGDGAQGTAVFVDVAERLRHLPWELLSHQGVYLCRNAFRPFTPIRLAAKTKRDHRRENRPLRILFMACSAENIRPVLHYESEEVRILDAAGRYD
ncbi:MAG: hypothetical protein L0Y75_11080, partial [Acidobacteria bacterium]|nr:hypothetical protein [Acidobacteriota bacterium]